MVFIAVGTQKQQFNRLFKLIEKSEILDGKELLAQSGYTKYDSKKIKMLGFISEEELDKNMNDAEYIICHGGVGTIFTALNKNKKVLVIPRLKKYKEHKNDHQLEICKELEKDGYILYLNENEDLDIKLKELEEKEFKKYSHSDEYIEILKKEI